MVFEGRLQHLQQLVQGREIALLGRGNGLLAQMVAQHILRVAPAHGIALALRLQLRAAAFIARSPEAKRAAVDEEIVHRLGVLAKVAQAAPEDGVIDPLTRQDLQQIIDQGQVFAALDTHAREIGVIDYHTGLGPYGHGELITSAHANPPAYARLCAWLGKDDITSPDLGNSSSAPLVGVNAAGMRGAASHAQVSVVALEFGVRPLDQTLDALRGDAWLHAHGMFGSPEWTAIKAEMRRVFYGDEPRWKEMIVARGFDVTRRMLAGLATA